MMEVVSVSSWRAGGTASRLTPPTITAWGCFRARAKPLPRSPRRACGSPRPRPKRLRGRKRPEDYKGRDFMRSVICTITATTLAFWLSYSTSPAQQGGSPQQSITSDAAGNPDQELGRRFLIKAGNLPPPKSDPVAASRSLVIPCRTDAPSDGGLHSHIICHGLGESSPPARPPQ